MIYAMSNRGEVISGTSWSQRSRRLPLVAVALLAIGVLASCQSGADESTSSTSPDVEVALPKECTPAAASGGSPTSVPEVCADLAFVGNIRDSGSEELDELDDDQLVGFGRGICTYARALRDAEDATPTYGQLLDSNANSWDVSKESVQHVLDNVSQLCPQDFAILQALREEEGPVAVDLSATGTGEIVVVYTMPDGSSEQETVEAPWSQTINLFDTLDVSIAVRNSDGDEEHGCSISVAESVLDEQSAGGDEAAECFANSAAIRSAGA